MKILTKIRNKLAQRRLNRMCSSGTAVIQGVGGENLKRRALLHYTIDSFVCPFLEEDFSRTSQWESPEIARILNRLGFRVDIVDRSNRQWMPEDQYDLIISNASGNSGQMYPTYAERMPSAIKVFYALGPDVKEANRKVQDRYDYLEDRYNVSYPTMRVMDKVDIERCMSLSDAILVLDDNGYSSSSYCGYGLSNYTVRPSSSPYLSFDPSFINTRKRNTFLAFVGNGFIAKGIDLLVETFELLPDCELLIAGPDTDVSFWELFGERINRASNISYVGFLTVGGKEYNALMAQCSYIVAPVASEGVCTSVTTCMRSGLVPVVPYEAGVDTTSITAYLTGDLSKLNRDLLDTIRRYSELSDEEYCKKVEATILKAQDFTQSSFTYSWTKALLNILKDNDRLVS